VHGNDDTSGALRSVHKIAGGMGWRQVAADVSLVGAPDKPGLAACEELGALLALEVAGY
jgi:hypothetical protein